MFLELIISVTFVTVICFTVFLIFELIYDLLCNHFGSDGIEQPGARAFLMVDLGNFKVMMKAVCSDL